MRRKIPGRRLSMWVTNIAFSVMAPLLTVLGAQVVNETSVESQVVTLPADGREALLLRIKNTGSTPSLVCVRTFSYRRGDSVRGEGMPHRCQLDTNFALVLPAESYFHRLGDAHNANSDVAVWVQATVLVRGVVGAEVRNDRQQVVEWEGTIEKARAAFRLLQERR